MRLDLMRGCDILAKHFLNDPDTLVLDSLKGLCALNPQLALDTENKGGCSSQAAFGRTHRSLLEDSRLSREPGSYQGRAHLRRWIGARAGSCRIRR